MRADAPPMRPRHRVDGLTVLWRGSLASCNYGCPYCPFAKTRDSRGALAKDRAALERFEAWATSRDYPLSIFFTPWGEALIRKYYRDALRRLSHAPGIGSVAIQTNLSCSIRWLEDCDLATLALWTTFHPGETDLERFVAKIDALERMGARYSVGVVGLRSHFDAIETLRARLPDGAYLWINAAKSVEAPYAPEEVERLVAVDPFFALNNRVYAVKGRACRSGETTISVDAAGAARRCHFLAEPIGDIYDADFEAALRPRRCPAERCRCHIGYSRLEALDLPGLFGDGFLERRAERPSRADAEARLAAFDAGAAR